MKLTFCPLFSGSSGNCIYVAAGDTRILIDAGLTGRQIEGALKQIDVMPETLNGIVITHEHSDHTKGVGVLSRRYHIPVYANEGTFEGMRKQIGDIAGRDARIFDGDFYIRDLYLCPFDIPHDAAAPVGYRVYAGQRSAAVATDMGHMRREVLNALAGTDVLLLESNHDPAMLMHNDHYSAYLKQRILSKYGHLSNEDSAKALLQLVNTDVRHVLLGHLSGENNTPELAMKTASECLLANGVVPGRDVFLEIVWRDRVSRKYDIE